MNTKTMPKESSVRWADKKWFFRSYEFKDFIPRKGFVCSEYFENN